MRINTGDNYRSLGAVHLLAHTGLVPGLYKYTAIHLLYIYVYTVVIIHERVYIAREGQVHVTGLDSQTLIKLNPHNQQPNTNCQETGINVFFSFLI